MTQTGTTFGHAATYSCNPGYTIVGATTTRVCNGTWTGVAPTCEPPPLRFELNGTVYANGSMIQASEIGNGEECLRCITDKTDCCGRPNRAAILMVRKFEHRVLETLFIGAEENNTFACTDEGQTVFPLECTAATYLIQMVLIRIYSSHSTDGTYTIK